jgi:3-oxoacyl-[acyl-carrier-protein] synthase III
MYQTSNLLRLCGAVLDGRAADGIVGLEDESTAWGLGDGCVAVCIGSCRARLELVCCGDEGLWCCG